MPFWLVCAAHIQDHCIDLSTVRMMVATVARQPGEFVGKNLTVCGSFEEIKAAAASFRVLASRGTDGNHGIYVDQRVDGFGPVGTLGCVSGIWVRRDGLTTEQALSAGQGSTTADGYDASHILSPLPAAE